MRLMFERLKSFLARRMALKRGQIPAQRWIDPDAVELTFSRSKVPVIFMMVLVWVVSVLLLTIATRQQRNLTDWIVGQKAPITLHAQVDFTYVDAGATARARREAREASPDFFIQDDARVSAVRKNFNDFFRIVRERTGGAEAADEVTALAAKVSPRLREALSSGPNDYEEFWTWLGRFLQRGIVSRDDKRMRNPLKKIRVVDSAGRAGQTAREIGEYFDPERVGEVLARELLRDGETVPEFADIAAGLIGSGTLRFDADRSGRAAAAAVARVPEIRKTKVRNDLLIRKGDRYTAEIRDMIAAERDKYNSANVRDFGELYENMLWSLVILLGSVFFYFRFSPASQHDNRNVVICGLVIIIALFADYGAIRGFMLSRESALSIPYAMVANAVPVTVTAVMLTVLIGVRAALCASLLVCSIGAMMIMPERSFELAVRWITICTGVVLLVRGVNNYRDYFLRTFIGVFLVTGVVNASLLFFIDDSPDQLLIKSALIILCNAFCVAVLSLVLIFVFELIFNVNTDMSLMVLCSGNHPLLERLKREANGTMHHSWTVATLAEDAAREIQANPLRAKAGALFHDIGKLVRPQFFVENNSDSVSLHVNLNPQMSNIIIREHVKEGMALARQYRLGRLIRDAIASHHGDDLVRYFYARAVAEARRKLAGGQTPVLEAQFRYQGEPPRSRELTIVSLADACEAACRSLDRMTPAKIREMVEGIFEQRFKGGQLRNSELTLRELDRVKESFISTLIGMNHGRIAYPTAGERHDDSALPLAEPPVSASEKK